MPSCVRQQRLDWPRAQRGPRSFPNPISTVRAALGPRGASQNARSGRRRCLGKMALLRTDPASYWRRAIDRCGARDCGQPPQRWGTIVIVPPVGTRPLIVCVHAEAVVQAMWRSCHRYGRPDVEGRKHMDFADSPERRPFVWRFESSSGASCRRNWPAARPERRGDPAPRLPGPLRAAL